MMEFYTDITRKTILSEAEKCICADRESQYGSPENSFSLIAEFWSTYKGISFSPHDVAIMMALLKIARITNGRFKADSYIDACGYLACAGEVAQKEDAS